jgi:acyl-CoA dehydrogenase
VARNILEDRAARLTLTQDIFVPPPDEPGLGALETALDRAVEAIPVETKLRDAVRQGLLDHAPGDALADLGLAAGIISADERETLRAARECRDEVIAVDAFDAETCRWLR